MLLEAGAGTGKTGVLVDRYCDLVADDGISPDQILAFTFTDKAAAQLRERVRGELRRRLAGGAGDPERLAELVARFGGAWITTIHGFCRRLLATHPVAAGIDPRFRVFDAPESARLARSAFDAALEDFLADRDPEREATVAAYRIEGLREMVVSAYEELRSRGHADPCLPDPPAADLEAALAELESSAEAALEAPGASAEQRRRLELVLELCRRRTTQPPSLDELSALHLGSPKGARGDCARALRAAVARAAEAGEGGEAYEHVRELLGHFGRRFSAEKAARSGLDFEDLQILAVRLLGNSELGEQYRERFSHLMVDEFQDTNGLQLELIEALRSRETQLLVVGDEFQSIYGFRHADLEVFREQRRGLADSPRGTVLPLSGNFRSRPEIVATANAIGSRMLDGFAPLSVGSEPPHQEPRGGGPAIELLLTERRGWDAEGIELRLPVDDRTPKESVAEARFLAARLRKLWESGVPRGEIVVLLRAFTHVDAFEEALGRAGLRPYVVGGRGYWSHQQVSDLRCLLSVIANPLDDEPLLGALASPAAGVSPDTLWILRRAVGPQGQIWPALQRAVGAWDAQLADPEWLQHIPAADAERLALFDSRISALREAASRIALEELIERAVAETGYDLAVLLRGSGELRLANVRKMMRMAREFESTEGRDLRGFLDFVAFRTGQDEEPIAATEAEDHDGVRVMTIHTAKGLEFPVVAVAGLGRGLLAGGRAPDLILGRGAGGEARVGMRLARLGNRSVDLFEREALREEAGVAKSAEELRLFYVAATRARERLLLSGVLAPDRPEHTKPGTAVSERLLEVLGVTELQADSTVTVPAPPSGPALEVGFGDAAIGVRLNRPGPERAAELARVAAAPQAPPQPAGGPPPIVEPASPVRPRRPLSYSALQSYERCGYRFYAENVLGLGRRRNGIGAGRDRSLAFGTAVHELLERSARNRWVEPTAQGALRVLAAHGLGREHEAERARQLVRGWIVSPLRAEIGDPRARLRSELPFLLELGGSVLRGKLDLLAEPPAGRPTVVDYKTDRLDGDEPAAHAERYVVQRDLYALATSSATGATSVRVVYVYLEQPDRPVVSELEGASLAEARERLEQVVARLATGSFEVTRSPDWELCRDCPARRRLCSAPAQPPAAGR